MNDKDLMTDIDLLILTTHPKYKDMALDKKLFVYYNQANQMEDRIKLLYESYSMESPEEGRRRLMWEISASLVSAGGLAFLAVYYKKAIKETPEGYYNANRNRNYERLNELLNAEDERQKKQKAKEKSIVHKVVDKVKEVFVPIKKIVTKPTIIDTAKKVVKDVTKKIIDGVKKIIPSKPSKPKQPKKSKKKGR